ncbi:ThiF family adenylyltransferase [Heyndrickxia sporothermodurans]
MDDRYSRQVLFAPIGVEGQMRISKKHVLVIGVGALGSSTSEMLVRAGVGKLTIIDRDYVESSNLQRQQLFSEKDAANELPKAIAAKNRLIEINQDIAVEAIVGEADIATIERLAPTIDLIVDGTDNFEIRLIINDLAHKFNIPWIFGACVGSYGSTYTINPGQTPCLSCLLKELPLKGQTCDTVGIIAPTVQMVTAHQMVEAIKILSENWSELRETYITFDLWKNQQLAIKVGDAIKNKDCLTCGENPQYPFLSYESHTKAAVLCGRNTVQLRPSIDGKLSLELLSSQWKQAGYEVRQNPYLLSVKKENLRMVLFKDGRALIHGTNSLIKAKQIYHSLMG